MSECKTVQGHDGFGWSINDCEPCLGDWAVSGGDFVEPNQLHSAVIIQLFTDRCAPERQEDKRGWWGDFYARTPIGSLLWTLYREPLKETTLLLAQSYAEEAIQPLVDQGAVASQSVTIKRQGDQLVILVSLFASDGRNVYSSEFGRFWQQA